LATKIPFDELERHFDIVLNILFFNKKVRAEVLWAFHRGGDGSRPLELTVVGSGRVQVELPRRPRRVTAQAEQQPQLQPPEQAEQQPAAEQDAPPAGPVSAFAAKTEGTLNPHLDDNHPKL
jgi:hypothetical protein